MTPKKKKKRSVGSFFARDTSPQPHLPTQHEKEKREKLEVDLFKKSRDDARTDLREMVPRGGSFFFSIAQPQSASFDAPLFA